MSASATGGGSAGGAGVPGGAGAAGGGRVLRRVAVLLAVVTLIAMGWTWARFPGTAGHQIHAYRVPGDGGAFTVVYPTDELGAGDRILAVDGIPAGEEGAAEALWRGRRAGGGVGGVEPAGRAGEQILLRVERAQTGPPSGASGAAQVGAPGGAPGGVPGDSPGSGQGQEVAVPIRPLLAFPLPLVLFAVSTIWALTSLAVVVFVALTRPQEPAARPLLCSGVVLALSVPAALLANPPSEQWPLAIRLSIILPAIAAACGVHLFLIFPQPHPLVPRLRALGPSWLRRLGGGFFLFYACTVLAAVALTADPRRALGGTVPFLGLCLLLTLALIWRSHRRPATPLVRAQLKWVLWGYAVTLVAVCALAAVIVLSGGSPGLVRAAVYGAATLIPLSLGFAVLRYRLFDVDTVVRASVTYGLLTALLLLGYLGLTFALSQAAVALANPAGASTTAPVLAALLIAAAAAPLRRRLQEVLDGLVYRARVARRRFLAEAGEVLSQAQPVEALVAFLTGQTTSRLDLTGAWLALPSGLAPPAGAAPPLPAPADPLLRHLARRREPAVLSQEDLSASAVATLPAEEPALSPWFDAGARLLIPLRAAPAAPAGASGEDGGRGGLADRHPASDDALVGVWVLGALRSGELPDRDDLRAVVRVGQQAAVLLNYARLTREQVRQALVNQDLDRAREIQQRLLPSGVSGWPGRLEVAVRLQPARETSGDFYDVFALSPAEEQEPVPLQIAVGDVQGKGIGAALVMGLAQATLRSTAHECGGPGSGVGQEAGSQARERGGVGEAVPAAPPPGVKGQVARDRGGAAVALAPVPAPPVPERVVPSPARTLRLTGALLHRSLRVRDFVACALAVVEPGPLPRLRLANAGQVPPLLCREGRVQELVPPGQRLPLGTLAGPEYEELSLDLLPGDVVVLATDGLPEAPSYPGKGGTDRAGELFGFERLAAVAGRWAAQGGNAEEVLDGIWADVVAWSGEASHHDDMTLVVLRVPLSQEKEGA